MSKCGGTSSGNPAFPGWDPLATSESVSIGGAQVMTTVRGFWQHTNGKVYAIESDTFGKILGAAGPLDPNKLSDLDDYDYRPAIVGWECG